jgi:hypothetical protein
MVTGLDGNQPPKFKPEIAGLSLRRVPVLFRLQTNSYVSRCSGHDRTSRRKEMLSVQP